MKSEPTPPMGDEQPLRRAEAALRESEARLRHLVEHAQGIIATHDLHGVLLTVNRGGALLLGYRAEAVVGQRLEELVGPQDRPAVGEYLQRMHTVGEDRGILRLTTAGGQVRFFQYHNTRYEGSGEPFVLVHAQDVTERVVAERDLRRRQKILDAAAAAAERFLHGVSWQEMARAVLERLGEATRVSRAYLFRSHRGAAGQALLSQLFEWVDEGVAPQIANPQLQDLDADSAGYSRWVEVLSRGESIAADVADLPAGERPLLEAQEIASIVVVPVFVAGTWWGFFGFDECRMTRAWSAAELEGLRVAAGILGAALERERVEGVLRESEGDLRRREAILQAVAFAAKSFLHGRAWQDSAAEALARLGEATAASRVFLYRSASGEEPARRVAAWTAPGAPALAAEAFHSLTDLPQVHEWSERLSRGQPVVARLAELPAEARERLAELSVRSFAVVPVVVQQQVWGVLGFSDCHRERLWSHGEVEGLRTAADVLAAAVLSDRAEAALRESEQRFRVLVQNVPGVVYLCRNDARYTMLYLSDEVAELTGLAASEFLGDRVSFVDLYHPEDGEGIVRHVDAALALRQPFVLVYRLRHADGEYRWIEERGQGVFDAAGELQYLEGTLVDITSRKRVEEQLVHNALHDPLTDLPNRALFLDRLEVAMGRWRRRDARLFAVLFVDLDRFKLVNDSLGHAHGDELLMAIAERLRRCLQPGDTVARLGGDEFALLVEDLDSATAAIRVAEQIADELAAPFELGGHELYTAASVGIVLARATYQRAEELLRDADTAMYRAKAQGRARHVVFDPEMHQLAVARLRLESDLRRALEREELELHYQPIVSLASGGVVGVEALLRWRHPEEGLLLPADFLEVAAETGLILPIGNWVVQQACRQAREWHRVQAGLGVHVNLHARELHQPGLVEVVQAALTDSGLAADRLHLELTEYVVMEEPDEAVEVLGRLRALGVRVCIDDFGIGYSSLSYLHRFPITTLKIDRSFVGRIGRPQDGTEIVRTIGALGRTMELTAIAEGVETEAQLAALRELGYELAQGYLFARPLPAAALVELLRRAPRW
ncbi:MAG TPA: EAL domain-containing protein [Thermoanaerobaculia bacterium]|nr:EAL domain-containing protein [Thermoanaerobaculia bacterium]